jgi:hypothetical protein
MKSAPLTAVAALTVLISACTAPATMWPEERGIPYCQILDDLSDPAYEFDVGYLTRQDFEDDDGSGMMELGARWHFAYFRNVLYGDVDCTLRARSTAFLHSSDLDLPSQVARLGVDAGWTHRFADGLAFQLRAAPGIYSDLEELGSDAFFFPFSWAVIRAFSPALSGIVGLDIRPGFDREIMPRIGLAWEPGHSWRAEARLPESSLTWFVTPDWSTRAGFEWMSMSYALEDGRDLLTLEDFRLSWELTYRLPEQIQVSARLGYAFGRDLVFDDVGPKEAASIDIDSGTFVRFALGGPF